MLTQSVSLCTSYRLGEVTLKDVKAAVDREGNYRYHFKALDPEFGTVKEEVRENRGIKSQSTDSQAVSVKLVSACRFSWMERSFQAGKER